MISLVTGYAKRSAPRPDIQSYTEGRSTFYAPAETIKLGACAPSHNPPFPIQETRSDTSLELSVTSQDVTVTMQQKQHKPLGPERSYDDIDSEEIKIVVVGDRFVGKSSLIVKTARKRFTCRYTCTRSFKFHSKTVKIKGKLCVINFWDVPNDTLVDEAQCKEFCKGAMAAFVVYDLSHLEQTLPTIVEWKKMINNNVRMENGDPIPVYLLGNKCDMEGCQRDGASFAAINKFAAHFRTSAKTGEGIEEAVKQAAKDIVKENSPHLPVIVETPDYLKE